MDIFGKEDFSSSNASLVASVAAAVAAATALRIETESTLSNITSLQSQSQSLYDSDSPSNQHIISNQHISRKSIGDEHHVVVVHNNNLTSSHKTLHKKSSMPSSSSSQQQQSASLYGGGYGGGVGDDTTSTFDSFDGIIAPPNSIVGNFTDGPAAVPMASASAGSVSGGASPGAFVAPTTPTNSTNVVNSNKTATILVSKTKTKTGLPLLLKNSIKN